MKGIYPKWLTFEKADEVSRRRRNRRRWLLLPLAFAILPAAWAVNLSIEIRNGWVFVSVTNAQSECLRLETSIDLTNWFVQSQLYNHGGWTNAVTLDYPVNAQRVFWRAGTNGCCF